VSTPRLHPLRRDAPNAFAAQIDYCSSVSFIARLPNVVSFRYRIRRALTLSGSIKLRRAEFELIFRILRKI